MNQSPVPNLWPTNTQNNSIQGYQEVRKNIQDLTDKIDQLSRAYNEKLQVSKTRPEVVESHSVTEEDENKKTKINNTDQEQFGGILQSFLNAQYNFYRNFNYQNTNNPNPYLKYQR